MNAERILKIFLRVYGVVAGLAIFAVFMPRACMAATHEAIGLGKFPDGAIVEYLARSGDAYAAIRAAGPGYNATTRTYIWPGRKLHEVEE